MIRLAWRTLAAGGTRTVATTIVMAAGALLLALALIVPATALRALTDGATVSYAGADIAVTTVSDDVSLVSARILSREITESEAAAIARLDGVDEAAGLIATTAIVRAGDRVRGIAIESTASRADFVWQGLAAGDWPTTTAEIALSSQTLRDLGITVGDRIILGTHTLGPAVFRVSGEIDTRGALDYASGSYGVVDAEVARAIAEVTGFTDLRIAVRPGVDARDVVEGITLIAPTVWPLAVSELARGSETVFQAGVDLLRSIVIALVALSLGVTALVLYAIRAVSLGSRTRMLALQRCVGATRAQVLAWGLTETAFLALAGGAGGVALAVAAAWALMPWVQSATGVVTPAALAVPWQAVVIPVAVVVVLGLVAGSAPLARAARVSPAVALTGTVTPASRPARRAAWMAGGVVSVGVGLALIAAGVARTETVLLALALALGVLLSALGMLALSSTVYLGVAAVVGSIGRTTRRAALALVGANLRRNPRHSAAVGLSVTLAALLMGTAVVAVSSVGQALQGRITASAEVDVAIGDVSSRTVIGPDSLAAIAGIDGVARVQGVIVAHDIRVEERAPSTSAGAGGEHLALWEVAIARLGQGEFAVGAGEARAIAEVRDDTLYLQATEYPPFDEAARVTASGSLGQESVRVEYVEGLPIPGFLSPELYDRLTAQDDVRAVWVEVDASAEPAVLLDRLTAEAVLAGGAPVGGALVDVVEVEGALGVVRATALAIISVAMLVALIGLSATTALAIAERRRENAVLRALGLERAQLRRSLLVESVLLALTGSALGVLLGILCGTVLAVGFAASLGLPPATDIPLLPLAGVFLLPAVVLWVTVDGVAERASLVAPALAMADQ